MKDMQVFGATIKSQSLQTSFEITVNTGHYENIKIGTGRNVEWEGFLTDEEQSLVLKDMYLDCVQDVIREVNFALKQFNRRAETGFPQSLTRDPSRGSSGVQLEDVEAE